MAERKPAARKTTPKRGVTKAAALKALGLTQEDLDTLKAVAAARNANNSDSEREALESIVGHRLVTPSDLKDSFFDEGVEEPTPTQEVHGSANLTNNSVTSRQPQDAQQELEERPAPQPQPSPASVPSALEPVWFMRNLRNVKVSFRLSRQDKEGARRTELNPRGQRGDMVRLQPEDLRDPNLQTQVSYGLVEVIPEGEALEAIKKQSINARQEVPAHIAMLRNPKGESYDTAPRTLSDEESMGYKVADLDQRLMQGKLSDKEIKRDGGFAQNASQTPTGGNPHIVSDGFMAPAQSDMSADNERARQIDELARSHQFEGPGAGLGEVVVKVEPVQRVR